MTTLNIVKSEEINEQTLPHFIIRSAVSLEDIKLEVLNIINNVKNHGDQALLEYTKKFDNVDLTLNQIKISKEEINTAYNLVKNELITALRIAKRNITKFHEAQLRKDWSMQVIKGVNAGQIYRPIESVGIYIPGGKAIYPSTVLMTAIPATIAGVKEIVLCSPPTSNNTIAPEILVAAKECNITNIFKIGGAQAIAAMAFGTNIIPKVLKIIGPGNKWINAAKQLLSNHVAIDTPAGPSEILIISDENSPLEYVLVDFISQIEHDPDNMGIIISLSDKLLDDIKNNIKSYIDQSERKEIINSALKNSLLIKARDIQEAIRISNLIAPEHLEIMVSNYREVMGKITNAGAIFLGPYSPVPLGDYSAGTNHVLPTGGNAMKYSGLNVDQFLKVIDVLECDEFGIRELSRSATTLADFEGLTYHKKAILERLKEKNKIN